MSIREEISAMRMDPPGGYGAFDEEQLYIRDEDAKEVCEDCGLELEDCKCYSPCCGADMRGGNGDASFSDIGICPECGEFV
jgi:hypothetical protein